jgi:thiamine-monophosphate kinase
MDPENAAPTVFLSYAGPERAQAQRVKNALEQRGIKVIMDVDFDPGVPVLINIGHAVRAGLFLPLISTQYLDRPFTQLEVSAAVMTGQDSRLLPVLIEEAPAPATEAGQDLWTVLNGQTYWRAAMTEESFDELAFQVQRRTRHGIQPVSLQDPLRTSHLSVALIYDWEDGNLADGIARQCEQAGLTVVHTIAAGVPGAGRQGPPDAHVAVPWTVAAAASPEVTEAIIGAMATERGILYLVLPGSPPCPHGGDFLRLDAPGGSPGHPERPVIPWRRDRVELRARLDKALRLNGGVPFHLLGDKFCASREAADTVTVAYEQAISQFPPNDKDRLEAVLAYAAVRRFHGEWRDAAEVLRTEPRAEQADAAAGPSLAQAITAEQLSLDFELGRVTDTKRGAEEILPRALAAGDWPLIIAIHRQLGMLAEEGGKYREAREHLDRACHYAEDLLETSFLVDRIPSYPARVALRADCLRELAAAEWRAKESDLALDHLDQAREALALAPIRDTPVAKYLLQIIDYQAARVAYATEHDYEAALGTLQASYHSLQAFDNPIRLATVLESLVLIEMDFLRGRDDSAPDLRATLEKIRRVRTRRGHDYLIARAPKSLGDLEFALGDFEAALRRYGEAANVFNHLGKYPELAGTLRSMAQCEARLGDPARAINMLKEFLEELNQHGLHAFRGEIRAEIARLRTGRVTQRQVGDDTEMLDVGEYSVHDWIAEGLIETPGDRSDVVVLGAGDDGAVLRLGTDEDLIVSTDSVPPGLMAADIADSRDSARYAARFAVVSALSDVIAMGGEPVAILVNLHLQRTTAASWARSFLRSVADEAARYGAVIVGGDLRERPHKALTVTAVGRVRKGQMLTRSGARPADKVVLTLSARPGQEFAGLGTRWAQELARTLSRNETALIGDLIARDAIFEDLGLPHEIMGSITAEGLANCAIDTSDGVLACAQLISDASEVGIELFPEELERIVNRDVIRLARQLGIAPFLFALNAGYDWEVVCSVPESRQNDLNSLIRAPGASYPPAAVIGEVVRRERWADEGVRLRTRSGSGVVLPYFTGEKFRPRTYGSGSHAREWLDFAIQSTRRVRP